MLKALIFQSFYFNDKGEVQDNKNAKKKKTISENFDWTSLVNKLDLLTYDHEENFSLWNQHRESQADKMGPRCLLLSSQSEHRILIILHIHGYTHLINTKWQWREVNYYK